MGVRLIYYNKANNGNGSITDGGTMDHDELVNRDLMNQHPIYAIIGLQEVLNILEDSVYDTNNLLLQKESVINNKIDAIVADIDIINQSIIDINTRIDNLNVINSIVDTYSVDLDYDDVNKILKADVKVFDDENDTNAIQVLAEGLYVPKTVTEDTDTITWASISVGETLLDIYNAGMRFSHYAGSWSNMYSSGEASAWYWDNNLQSFVQPNNTSYLTGFITSGFYDYYEHTATIKSTNSDDDSNGLVICFAFDENDKPHTLTAIVDSGGMGIRWALVYDYSLPDATILINGTAPSNRGSGWSSRTGGITIKVTKFQNKITAMCSNWNSTDLNPNTLIELDLDNYAWGYLFRNKVRYGYCNFSQAYTYFSAINFHSDNTATSDKLLVSVKVSEEDNNEIKVYEDGIYAPTFIIDPDATNALVKNTNGYYVEEFTISDKEDNCLQKLDSGYYVREHSNVKLVTQTAHGFSVGDFIYYEPTRIYKLALGIDSYDINIVGMVTNIIDEDTFEYQWSGFFKTDLFSLTNDYIQGLPLYISDTEPGKVTQTQPDISKAVGYPIEDIGLIISIERGIQYNQEATIGDFKTSANDYNIRSDGFIRITEDVDYKKTLVDKLLQTMPESFKNNYIIEEDDIIRFINTEQLYDANNVAVGLNLFIKAF